MKKSLLSLSVILLLPFTSSAYYTTMDTAELPKEGKYDIMAQGQFITDGESGINMIGSIDGRINSESGWRAEAGFGVVDMQAAAYYKWAPIPDIGSQPGMAVLGGLNFARSNGFNELSVRVVPIISKIYIIDAGDFTPFASLPITMQSIDGNTIMPIQLTVGTHYKSLNYSNVTFRGELGLDVNKAFTYFTVGIVLNGDFEDGFKFN